MGLRWGGALPHAEAVAPRLDRCQLLKLRRRLLEMEIEIVGEEVEVAVIVLIAVVVTAIVLVADAIEARRIVHRQRAQRMPCTRVKMAVFAPMPSAECNHDGEREAGLFAQLAQRVAKILDQ